LDDPERDGRELAVAGAHADPIATGVGELDEVQRPLQGDEDRSARAGARGMAGVEGGLEARSRRGVVLVDKIDDEAKTTSMTSGSTIPSSSERTRREMPTGSWLRRSRAARS
jgi:hypothetical protein